MMYFLRGNEHIHIHTNMYKHTKMYTYTSLYRYTTQVHIYINAHVNTQTYKLVKTSSDKFSYMLMCLCTRKLVLYTQIQTCR